MGALKIYIMDCGYRGVIICVASSAEEAREEMKTSTQNYEEKNEITEHEINKSFFYYNLGDA